MPTQNTYGPDNPHPFSQIRTELIWEGKYDEYGNRREVDIAGASMPLQRIETVDEPRSRALVQGTLFDTEKAHRDDFRNMLIWGDNKLIMASLLREYKGKVDLIYIDPPFNVGADFTMSVPVGDENDSVYKDQSTLEMVAYKDMWGKGTDSYIHMMHERIMLMKELLSDKGSLFVHVDWRVSSFLRLILDGIFGEGAAVSGPGFRNEIAYCYSGGGIPKKEMPRKHDTIFWYTKSIDWVFNTQFRPYSEGTIERGRTAVKGPNAALNPEGTPINDWWNDVKKITSPTDPEKLYYDTQKSEELLQRIISMCSNEGDLVADFFCGSGTTGAVAESTGRRWVMADLGRFAIHTSRKRLIELQRKLHNENQPYRSFDVYNLGRYERQWWQKEALKGADTEHRRVVLEFYRAEILTHSTSPLLHGRKAGAFVHVDRIDSIFTRNEVKTVALAAKEAGGKEVNCLSWEFEMDLRMTCDALENELGIKIKLIPIPREIMERNRKEPPPFLEVATLQAEPVYQPGDRTEIVMPGTNKGIVIYDLPTVDIKLTKFIPSLSEVPSKELDTLKERAMESGFDFIDFWAIDFDYHPDQPFNHHWQAFRTRKNRALPTISDLHYEYAKGGEYLACIKVVDVFGVDTSITVDINI